jgi:hypothetical protein
MVVIIGHGVQQKQNYGKRIKTSPDNNARDNSLRQHDRSASKSNITRKHCCGAKNPSFGSAKPQIRIAAPAPAPDSFLGYLENYLLFYSSRYR